MDDCYIGDNQEIDQAGIRYASTQLEKGARFSQLDEDDAARLYEQRYRQIESDMLKKIQAKRAGAKKPSAIPRSSSSNLNNYASTPSHTQTSWKHQQLQHQQTQLQRSSLHSQQQLVSSSKFQPAAYMVQSTSLSGGSRISTEENCSNEVGYLQQMMTKQIDSTKSATSPHPSNLFTSWKNNSSHNHHYHTNAHNYNNNNHDALTLSTTLQQSTDLNKRKVMTTTTMTTAHTRVETSPASGRIMSPTTTAAAPGLGGFYSPQSRKVQVATSENNKNSHNTNANTKLNSNTSSQGYRSNTNASNMRSHVSSASSKQIRKVESNLSINQTGIGGSGGAQLLPSKQFSQEQKIINFGFPSPVASSYLLQANLKQSINYTIASAANAPISTATKSNSVHGTVVNPMSNTSNRKSELVEDAVDQAANRYQTQLLNKSNTQKLLIDKAHNLKTDSETIITRANPQKDKKIGSSQKGSSTTTHAAASKKNRIEQLHKSDREIPQNSSDNSAINTPRSQHLIDLKLFAKCQKGEAASTAKKSVNFYQNESSSRTNAQLHQQKIPAKHLLSPPSSSTHATTTTTATFRTTTTPDHMKETISPPKLIQLSVPQSYENSDGLNQRKKTVSINEESKTHTHQYDEIDGDVQEFEYIESIVNSNKQQQSQQTAHSSKDSRKNHVSPPQPQSSTSHNANNKTSKYAIANKRNFQVPYSVKSSPSKSASNPYNQLSSASVDSSPLQTTLVPQLHPSDFLLSTRARPNQQQLQQRFSDVIVKSTANSSGSQTPGPTSCFANSTDQVLLTTSLKIPKQSAATKTNKQSQNLQIVGSLTSSGYFGQTATRSTPNSAGMSRHSSVSSTNIPNTNTIATTINTPSNNHSLQQQQLLVKHGLIQQPSSEALLVKQLQQQKMGKSFVKSLRFEAARNEEDNALEEISRNLHQKLNLLLENTAQCTENLKSFRVNAGTPSNTTSSSHTLGVSGVAFTSTNN